MKVKCSNCPAEMELGIDAEDIGDTAYKLLCPVLRKHPPKGHDIDTECPYMRDAQKAAALRRRHAI